ncbi:MULTISPECIES: hypothetical protein [unclassified Nocardioides]|uniref:hypothetical protein n=1 Tax=unclassified Nocardioides TaxID=2615069 RepID=UPI0036088446
MKHVTRIGAAGLVTALAVGVVAPVATADRAAPERRSVDRVTLETSKTELVAGKKVVLSGKIRPAAKGTKVVLQKKIGDRKWSREATLTTKKAGKFSYTDRPETPGTRRYRVVTQGAGARTSKPVKVTIYQWRNLTDTAVRETEAVDIGGIANIRRTAYPDSVVSYFGDVTTGGVDWNLDPTCTTLSTRFGAGDASDEGAVATLSLVGDGEPLYTGSFGLTESEARTFDVSGVFRLRLSWTSTVNGTQAPGAQAVMATPRLLCAS